MQRFQIIFLKTTPFPHISKVPSSSSSSSQSVTLVNFTLSLSLSLSLENGDHELTTITTNVFSLTRSLPSLPLISLTLTPNFPQFQNPPQTLHQITEPTNPHCPKLRFHHSEAILRYHKKEPCRFGTGREAAEASGALCEAWDWHRCLYCSLSGRSPGCVFSLVLSEFVAFVVWIQLGFLSFACLLWTFVIFWFSFWLKLNFSSMFGACFVL